MAHHGEGVSLDPMCGRTVDERSAVSLEYGRTTYYFCSVRCRTHFAHHAERIHVAELAKIGGLFTDKRTPWGVA